MDRPLNLAAVRAAVAAHLYLEGDELADTENLFDAGLDSLRLFGLIQRWRELGVEVNFADLAEQPTLESWWALISDGKPARG